jgi:hypothetical protein
MTMRLLQGALAGLSALVLSLLVNLPLPLFGQGRAVHLMILGNVRDPSSVAVAGARVELLQQDGQVEQTTTTDASGTFRFADVSPGSHFVDVKQQGFNPVHHLVRVGAQPPPAVKIVLSLASRREEVTVRGNPLLWVRRPPKIGIPSVLLNRPYRASPSSTWITSESSRVF